jgi:cytochrome c553
MKSVNRSLGGGPEASASPRQAAESCARRAIRYGLTAVLVSVPLACGSGQATAETPANEPAAAQEAPADAALTWATMNREQRLEFMGLTVLPEMKQLFQKYDASYAEFKCQTCHGDDMKEVDFKMPNGLFPLTKPNPIPAAKDYDEQVTNFMQTEVVPRMGELLGTADSFNCFACHDTEE